MSLDLGANRVELDDGGQRRRSTALVLATGSTPRVLPGTPDLDGLFVLRTLEDALAIREPTRRRTHASSSSARGSSAPRSRPRAGLRGLEVTVLEALPAPLVRGLGPVLGMVCGELHRDHGVDLRLGVGVAGFDGTTQRRARPARRRHRDRRRPRGGGRRRRAGHRTGSRDPGSQLDNGVVCDATLLAAPGVVSAGDITRWPNPLFGGELMRLEHWTNASEQGVAAARRLLYGDGAAPEPFAPVPFVWSDQYDRKIQSVGALPR